MLARLLYSTKWFVMLIALQVLVFNHIHIAGYATPLPYVYFLLILPSDTPRSALLMWGFALGFIVDTFTNTPGMAAAALTFIGFIRPALLHFFSPRDKDDNAYLPSVTEMRRSSFFGYVLVAVLLHESIFFSLEAFTLYNWQELLINIATSSALTTLIIIAIESIRSSVRTTPKE